MTYVEDEIERLQCLIERTSDAIKKAKKLLDEQYSDNRSERYERLRDSKYELEQELEILTDDTFDGDPECFKRQYSYAPIEGFFYG